MGQLWDHGDHLVSEESDGSLLEGFFVGADDNLLWDSHVLDAFSKAWSGLDLEFAVKVADPGESGVPGSTQSSWSWDQSHSINGSPDVGGSDRNSTVKFISQFQDLFNWRSSGWEKFFNGIHGDFLKAFEINEDQVIVEKADIKFKSHLFINVSGFIGALVLHEESHQFLWKSHIFFSEHLGEFFKREIFRKQMWDHVQFSSEEFFGVFMHSLDFQGKFQKLGVVSHGWQVGVESEPGWDNLGNSAVGVLHVSIDASLGFKIDIPGLQGVRVFWREGWDSVGDHQKSKFFDEFVVDWGWSFDFRKSLQERVSVGLQVQVWFVVKVLKDNLESFKTALLVDQSLDGIHSQFNFFSNVKEDMEKGLFNFLNWDGFSQSFNGFDSDFHWEISVLDELEDFVVFVLVALHVSKSLQDAFADFNVSQLSVGDSDQVFLDFFDEAQDLFFLSSVLVKSEKSVGQGTNGKDHDSLKGLLFNILSEGNQLLDHFTGWLSVQSDQFNVVDSLKEWDFFVLDGEENNVNAFWSSTSWEQVGENELLFFFWDFLVDLGKHFWSAFSEQSNGQFQLLFNLFRSNSDVSVEADNFRNDFSDQLLFFSGRESGFRDDFFWEQLFFVDFEFDIKASVVGSI